MSNKVSRDELVDYYDAHCRKRYPREFANMSETGKRFSRNMYVDDAEGLYNYVEFFDFINCFVSVYSFDAPSPEMGAMWPRDKVIIDVLFMDFDEKENPSSALKDAQKFVKFLLNRGSYPLVYFSGSKGFHVYVPFKPAKLTKPKDTLKRVMITITELLELKTADLNVADIARVARLPFTVNTKSGRMCVPISPQRLLKMTYQDVVHFVKENYDAPEYRESGYFREFFEYVDVALVEMRQGRGQGGDVKIKGSSEWRKKRIEYYINVAKKHGRLAADEKIRQIHSKSEWVARAGGKEGAIEHIARVHFVLLLLQEGYTEEEIHKIFTNFKDYTWERTQYFIDYNRRRLNNSTEGG